MTHCLKGFEDVISYMSDSVDVRSRPDDWGEYQVPAYGPIGAVLGYLLFYVVVDRATPTVVAVFTDVLPYVAPSLVRLALATMLWFVLLVTLLDQVRRQLAALGVLTHDAIRPRTWSRPPPAGLQSLAYLVLVLVGGALATATFDRAIDTVLALIPILANLDVQAFVTGDVLVMVVFFVSFGVATRSLDRLIIGEIRKFLAE